MASTDNLSNKEIVRRGLHELWNNRDLTAVDRYWGKPYIQHNPDIPNGTDGLAATLASLPQDFRYDAGLVLADGDYVVAHGRYFGWGPKPVIAIEIFRLENGRLMEHWDVVQDEVPAHLTKSGNPMFVPIA